MAEIDLDDIERRMDGALDALGREFAGLRTGRASATHAAASATARIPVATRRLKESPRGRRRRGT